MAAICQQATAMPADPKSQPASEPDQLEAATDQAIAACGGKAERHVLLVCYWQTNGRRRGPRPFQRTLHQAP